MLGRSGVVDGSRWNRRVVRWPGDVKTDTLRRWQEDILADFLFELLLGHRAQGGGLGVGERTMGLDAVAIGVAVTAEVIAEANRDGVTICVHVGGVGGMSVNVPDALG